MEREERKRAKFWDCWNHWIDSLPEKGSRNAGVAKKPLAEFCGVPVDTVTSWTSGRNRFQGVTIFKVQCFLQAAGYHLTDLSRRSAVVSGLCEILGYNAMSAEEMRLKLGYKDVSRLFAMLRGEVGLSDDKYGIALEIHKSLSEVVAGAKQSLADILQEASPLQSAGVLELPDKPKVKKPMVKSGGIKQATEGVKLAAHLIQATVMQLQVIGDIDAEQRLALRQQSDDSLLVLQKLINELTEKMYRDALAQEKQNGT